MGKRKKRLLIMLLALSMSAGGLAYNYAKASAANLKWISNFSTDFTEASTFDISSAGVGVAVDGTIYVNGDASVLPDGSAKPDGTKVTWTSSNSDLEVSYDETGSGATIKGKSKGTAVLSQNFIYNVTKENELDEPVKNEDYKDKSELALDYSSLSLFVDGDAVIEANKDGVTWASSNSSVVSVNGGELRTLKAGNAIVTATYKETDEEGNENTEEASVKVTVIEKEVTTSETKSKEMTITVTDPSFVDPTVKAFALNATSVSGTATLNDASTAGKERVMYAVKSSDVSIDANGNFKTSKVTDTTVYAYVDGKTISARLKTTRPTFNSLRYTIIKIGSYQTFSMSGASGLVANQYSIDTSSYMCISGNKFYGKKLGKTIVTATVDNTKFTREYWAVPSKIYTIMTQAWKIYDQKLHYSQARRGLKGYTDCSAYVWRLYKNSGITLVSGKVIPTAAGEAYWLNQKGRLSKPTATVKKNVRPGDLLFYAHKVNGKLNKRYKHISHVEIYISNGISLGASGPYYKDAGGCVAEGDAWESTIVAVGRPYVYVSAPSKSSIKTLAAKSKGFKVSWSKSNGSGYQIQYSTKSSMKSSKTITISKNSTVSRTVKKLKKNKRYYVRVRAYKKSGSTKVYSSWSAKQSVKTK